MPARPVSLQQQQQQQGTASDAPHAPNMLFGGCDVQVLIEEIQQEKMSLARTDWTGHRHSLSFNDSVSQFILVVSSASPFTVIIVIIIGRRVVVEVGGGGGSA